MSHPLDECRVNIGRADDNIAELKTEIDSYLNSNPYAIDWENDAQARKFVCKARIIRSHSLKWRVRVGEIVHDLRSALDHLAWQLVILNGETPDTKTEFPVFWDAAKYKSESPRKVRRMSQAARAHIERLQPYNAAARFEDHVLYVVHQLNLADKHRLLNVVASAFQVERLGLSGIAGTAAMQGIAVGGRATPFEHGAEIVRVEYTEVDSTNPQMSVELGLIFGVAFSRGGPGKGQLVVPLLDSLAKRASSTRPLAFFRSFRTAGFADAHGSSPGEGTTAVEGIVP